MPCHARRRSGLPRLAAAALAPVLSAVAGPVTVAQQAPPQVDAGALVGRWSGSGYIRGVETARAASPLILDLATCGAKVCGRFVKADGTCSDVALEIDTPQQPDHSVQPPSGRSTVFHGRILVADPIAIAVTHSTARDGKAAELRLRDLDVPIYSRRLPMHANVSLTRLGPSACEPRRTS